MFLGKFYISDHVIERYYGRVKPGEKKDIIRNINYDLRTLNIKNIIYVGKDIHIFTRGYKEFIFVKAKRGLCLKTMIKRNNEDTKKTINKKLHLVTN